MNKPLIKVNTKKYRTVNEALRQKKNKHFVSKQLKAMEKTLETHN